ETARSGGGGWGGPAQGKADSFGPNFFRMLGLLRPYAFWFVLVSLLGAGGVVLAVIAPRVLGEATNVVFEGFVSSQLGTAGVPAGLSQEQVVELLRSQNQGQLADMVAAMHNFQVGAGIDFDHLRQIITAVLAIYVGSAF